MKQEDQDKLKEFKNQHGNPQQMTLDTYTGLGENRTDFTYWVERKLDCFGGIKGGSSFKFGIYKYNNQPEKREGYNYDDKYAWATKYGKNSNEVFNKIKELICKVVESVKTVPVCYDSIEKIDLGDAYKWKIAYLYSNNNLVPVYQKEALATAAKRFGVYPDDDKNDNKITIAGLQKILVEYFNKHNHEFNNDILQFGFHVWQIGTSDLSQSNQIIKYGAPGTGKTYTAKKEAEEFFNIWKLDARNTSANFSDHYEFVQFHPSFSYEDFIEGIKPVIQNGKTELVLKNGIFKIFCKKAAEYELWLLNKGILKYKKTSDDEDSDDKDPYEKVLVETVRQFSEEDNYPFKELPQSADNKEPISKYIPPYFFLIDEINRADLSRVFGELMYCLEYRGYKGRIKTQYSELEAGETIFYKDKNTNQHYFFIPHNVYIIGTMNTIDRSIESFDFALRRRFLWQRIDPNETVLQDYFDKEGKPDFATIIPFWKALNKKIANENPLLGEDYQIGHSYLMKLDKYPNCTTVSYRNLIWEKHILPILEEYFRGTGDAKTQIAGLKSAFVPSNKKKQ